MFLANAMWIFIVILAVAENTFVETHENAPVTYVSLRRTQCRIICRGWEKIDDDDKITRLLLVVNWLILRYGNGTAVSFRNFVSVSCDHNDDDACVFDVYATHGRVSLTFLFFGVSARCARARGRFRCILRRASDRVAIVRTTYKKNGSSVRVRTKQRQANASTWGGINNSRLSGRPRGLLRQMGPCNP